MSVKAYTVSQLAKTVSGPPGGKKQATLLRIVTKRVIVRVDGEINDPASRSPFPFLRIAAHGLRKTDRENCGLDHAVQGCSRC
jgi:hypothetical protein